MNGSWRGCGGDGEAHGGKMGGDEMVRERETYSALVQDSQFAFWGLFVGRVGEDAAVEEGAVGVCYHAACEEEQRQHSAIRSAISHEW
jgi:hypothetical protein